MKYFSNASEGSKRATYIAVAMERENAKITDVT
jgi:hypothetical protein